MIIQIVLLIVVLLFAMLAGFFSGSETVFTCVSRLFIKEQADNGDATAKKAKGLIETPEKFLTTTLVGTNLCLAIAAALYRNILSNQAWLPVNEDLFCVLTLTPFVVIFSEMLPKALGRIYARPLALRLAPILYGCEVVMRGLNWGINIVANSIMKVFGLVPATVSSANYVSRKDLRDVAELVAEQGIIPPVIGSMLCAVFKLDERLTSSVMIPLVNICSVSKDAKIADLDALIMKNGLSRFPVYDGRVDNIIGVVDTRSYLYDIPNGKISPNSSIQQFIQSDIMFVPETKAVGTLLHELRYHKIPMAVVVDEHGGVIGMVTMEDLLEEIVGEIHDERDLMEKKMIRLSDKSFICSGKMDIKELEELLKININKVNFDTVAGLILKISGRIPRVGERVFYQGIEFEVLEMQQHRIASIRVQCK